MTGHDHLTFRCSRLHGGHLSHNDVPASGSISPAVLARMCIDKCAGAVVGTED